MSLSRRLGAFACGAVLVGCAAEPPPTTLTVSGVEPREVDIGDRIEISGGGFPTRKTARIIFRGTVHRAGIPGEPVAAAIEVESRSEGRLEIPVDGALADRFAATGDAGHATFRGDVTVTFAPGEPGAAALAGKATGVVLDVRGGRSAKPERREQLAKSALDQLGIEIGGVAAASGGLVVGAVRSGSPASGAGLLPNDVILDFDGVRVGAVADLVPSGDEVAMVNVRRTEGGELRTIAIPLDGVARRVPKTFAFAGSLVGAASLLLLLAMRRPSATAAIVERRIAVRVRALAERRGARLREGWRAALSVLAGERAFRPSLDAVLFTGAVALVGCAAPMLAPDLDAATLSLAAIAGASALALTGGASVGVAATHGAGALAIASSVITSGSFRMSDVLRAQGAAPWEWLAFRSPATLLAASVWIVAAASVGASSTASKARPSERGAVAVAAALVAVFFFGGWRVPGARAIEHQGWSLAAIGAAIFVAKAWLAALAIDVVRALLPIVHAHGRGPRMLVPAALLGPVLSIAWTMAQPSVGVVRAVALATFGAIAVMVTWGAIRLVSCIERIGAGHLDPNA
ncbi:MAG: PDZ domain-containing protein [Deltaproteobacteria bacterium]|nr:PDZ domain-containing protein [Deltaproteobacteria bacterium]